MIWLNLKTTTLRSPEYAGSEPIQRATWLNLLAYCCEQENGGKIDGCGEWKDRQWQQTLGVTLAEVREECALWHWAGDALCVAFYPTDKQEEVKAKREAGKRGGKRSGKARREAVREAQLEAVLQPQLEAHLERKGKERKDKGKIKEVGQNVAAVAATSDEDWLAELGRNPAYAGLSIEIEANKMRAWCSANGKQPTRRRFVNWLNRVDKPINGAVLQLNGHNGHPKPTEGVWHLEKRIEAAQKEIERIQANPSNKEPVPGTFDRRLKPEHLAKVKALKASISEMRQRMVGVEVAA